MLTRQALTWRAWRSWAGTRAQMSDPSWRVDTSTERIMSPHDCPLCSSIQDAVSAEGVAVERLFASADAVQFQQLPPVAGDGVDEDEWMEFACRRDEYDRKRSRRLRADNRFFDECPRGPF